MISSRRRICGKASRSHALWPASPRGLSGSVGVWRTQYHEASGSAAITAKATRKPAWSINNPAAKGPMKLAIDGAMASQLKTCLSSVVLLAMRLT